MNLNGKVAVITGSSRGIGYEIARLFLMNGAKVAICGSSIDRADEAMRRLIIDTGANEDMVKSLGFDIGDSMQVKDAISSVTHEWGHIDILVNNAGISSHHSFLDTTDEEWNKMFEVNFFGTVRMTREVVRYMKDTGGSIINTASMVGIYGGVNQADYASSKSAIIGLTKSLAKELGKYNIRVNAVAPGVVQTDMMSSLVDDALASRLSMMTPLNRMAKPSDLAGAYLYLASDMASFTTGTVIQVDGGLVM